VGVFRVAGSKEAEGKERKGEGEFPLPANERNDP